MIGQRFAANVRVSVKKKVKDAGLKDENSKVNTRVGARTHTHAKIQRKREMENAIVH